MTMSHHESQPDLSRHFWWHSIRLDDGRITPGVKSIEAMDRQFQEAFSGIDFNGLSVLDVGAWNGGFSIEAKRRGATRVVALDHTTWDHRQRHRGATFYLATRLCNVQIGAVDLNLDSPQVAFAPLGIFYVLFFFGVF